MRIKEIKKFNLEDGDILLLLKPAGIRMKDFSINVNYFADRLQAKFPEKRFICIDCETNEEFNGVRIIHMNRRVNENPANRKQDNGKGS